MDRYQREELAQLRRLEIISMIEATTLLVLVGIAVPLKHLGEWRLGVQLMGPVHGIAFIAYVWATLQTVSGGRWRPIEVARMIAVAFVPLGGFLNRPFLARKAAELRVGEPE